jgi:hypothetical protein
MRSCLIVETSEFGVVVRNAKVSMLTGSPPFRTGPMYRRQIPGNANSGRGSLPTSANQCHVAGFTSPFGSQKDDAGTRQRRSWTDPTQNLLANTLSSA